MSSAYRDIEVSKELRQCDVTKLGRENTMISIEYRFRSHDDQDIVRQVNFSLKPEGFLASMEEFDKIARGGWGANRRLPVPPNTIERTKMVFSNNPYYLQAFEFYQSNTKTEQEPNSNTEANSVAIGEAINDAEAEAANEEEQVKREEAYASAISDPDYDHVKKSERLTPITVPNALRKDPGRYCVYGIIDTVKNPFKLITEVGFTCTNLKCQSCNNPKWKIIDTPIFSVDDMPIAFRAERDKTGKIMKTGQQRYLEFLRCPDCNHNRQVRPRYEHFDNAKIIELKKLERINKVSTAIANNTLNLERLTVLVMGNHTWSVGFGEEVEIIGDLYILGSLTSSSRFGTGNRSNVDSGKAYPILYADKIKYTKRQREINTKDYNKLLERDAFNKFASYQNLKERLTSMVSPQIYGHDDAKFGILLLAAGAGPVRRKDPNLRYWINAGLFGDKGTAKTTMAEDAAKLVLGSQIVSGQHSTGKGIVAIAERENGSGAFLRVGVAVLASGAICVIDEFGLLHPEDQNQFLSLMEKGVFHFNKMGIRQKIEAKISFIVTSNPMGGKWGSNHSISKSDIPLKAQIIDRIDLFFVFREPDTPEAIEEFKKQKAILRKKNFKTCSINKATGETKYLEQDFPFLRYYLYYIRTQSRFQQIEFEEPYLEDRLADLWAEIKKANPEEMTSRGFESIYRIAEAFARVMLKSVIDSEIVDQTIEYVSDMYRSYGSEIAETPNYRDLSYLEIARVVKDHALNVFWKEGENPELDELKYISWNVAAEEAASKDENVRLYLGKNFRDSNSRSARNLKELFREQRAFDGGKIKDVSKDKYAELKLTWIANPEEFREKEKETEKEMGDKN